MSEAVLDGAIEQIADGLTVDWNALDKDAPAAGIDSRRMISQPSGEAFSSPYVLSSTRRLDSSRGT
jgi:hypothetical protein